MVFYGLSMKKTYLNLRRGGRSDGVLTVFSIVVSIPESFWAKGSSNSGGLSNIFTS